METPLIILDLETTGLSAYRHHITEIAAIKMHKGEKVDEFHTLVNPGYPIPKFITKLTGITTDMVKDAPKINEVLPNLKEFLGDDIIVAHNAGFDFNFLAYNFLMHEDHKLSNQTLCTYKLANRLLDIPRKRLVDCCDHFDVVNSQAHRAMSDVIATVQVLAGMVEMLTQSNISTSQDIIKFHNLPRARALRLLSDE